MMRVLWGAASSQIRWHALLEIIGFTFCMNASLDNRGTA